jgi:hypothetical protein
MTDLSNFVEEDITRWPEDDHMEARMGLFVHDEFEGEDGNAQSV